MTSLEDSVGHWILFFVYGVFNILSNSLFFFWCGVPSLWILRKNSEDILKNQFYDEGNDGSHHILLVLLLKSLYFLLYTLIAVLTAYYSCGFDNLFKVYFTATNTYISCQNTFGQRTDLLVQNVTEFCQTTQYFSYFHYMSSHYFAYQDPANYLSNYSDVDISGFRKASLSNICVNYCKNGTENRRVDDRPNCTSLPDYQQDDLLCLLFSGAEFAGWSYFRFQALTIVWNVFFSFICITPLKLVGNKILDLLLGFCCGENRCLRFTIAALLIFLEGLYLIGVISAAVSLRKIYTAFNSRHELRINMAKTIFTSLPFNIAFDLIWGTIWFVIGYRLRKGKNKLQK
jgi:hypothetical protein